MSKIYILHENQQWFVPIEKILSERNIPFESIFLDGGGISLSEKPAPGVYFSKMSASCATRGHDNAPDYAAALMTWLEVHKARIINGPQVLRLEISKFDQYARLREAEFNVPKTVACFGRKDLLKAAESFAFPLILKPNRGGKGIGVQLMRSRKILEDYVASEDYAGSFDQIMLLQEYIKAPAPFITRAEFIGGKFVYAVRVDTSEGFELCPAEACRTDAPAKAGEFCAIDASEGLFKIIEDYDGPVVKKLEGFLARNGIEVAGVEFIHDARGDAYIYDINTNTNYNPEAEKKAGRFALPVLADFLEEELAKITVGSSL